MAAGTKTSPSKNQNDERRNKKAYKKNPGVAPGAHNGKSVGGYAIKNEPLRQERKEAARAVHLRKVAAVKKQLESDKASARA